MLSDHEQDQLKIHWWLDFTFKQDQSGDRNRVGARNLTVVRKPVLNALLKEKSLKEGIATKQCAAACNPAYNLNNLNFGFKRLIRNWIK